MNTYNDECIQDYTCPDCSEAKLQSEKNARKINEVIEQVNKLIQVNNETVDFIYEKVNEVLGDICIKIEKNTNDIKKLMENNNVPSVPTFVSAWKGKTASFYGDSLTEVNYHYTKGYHQWIKEILELDSYNNYGTSGYTLSNIYSKINEVTDDSDLIIVMGGVNDQNFSIPLGTIDDNTTSTTYGSINLICSKLKEKYPTKTIIFITPHIQTKYPHNNGITSKEVADAIIEVCNKHSIPVYDNYSLCGITIENLSSYTTDNCHWNDTAHEMVGKNLSEFIKSNFKPNDYSTEEPPIEEPPIEEFPVYGPPFDGTKITLTESQYTDSIHFVALCSKDSNFNNGDTVEFLLNFDEADGFNYVQGATIFADNSGELSNSAYVSDISKTSQCTTNGNQIVSTYIINKASTSQYVKIPIKIYVSKFPSSFKIISIGIKCNDENIEILKLGGFFASEKITITRTA